MESQLLNTLREATNKDYVSKIQNKINEIVKFFEKKYNKKFIKLEFFDDPLI